MDAGDGHPVFGQGAGLVRADNSGGAEGFHGGQAIDLGVVFEHSPHAPGQGDGGDDGQTFGNGGHRQDHGGFDDAKGVVLGEVSDPPDHPADDEGGPDQTARKAIQPLFQRGLFFFGLFGHGGDIAQFGVHAGGYHHPFARAPGHGGAFVGHVFSFRQRNVGLLHRIDPFFHRRRFAGQGRLVDLEFGRLIQPNIRRHHIPGLEGDQVSGHQFFGRYFIEISFPDRLGFGRSHAPKRFHGANGLEFGKETQSHRNQHRDGDGGAVEPFSEGEGDRRGRRQKKHHQVFPLIDKNRKSRFFFFGVQPVGTVLVFPLFDLAAVESLFLRNIQFFNHIFPGMGPGFVHRSPLRFQLRVMAFGF